MSFLDLPDEIISSIVEEVREPESLEDEYLNSHCKTGISGLWSLSLCNRRLHYITEPILYSQFGHRLPKDLWLFMRTVLANPGLARHVKSITTWPYVTTNAFHSVGNDDTRYEEVETMHSLDWELLESLVMSENFGLTTCGASDSAEINQKWIQKLKRMHYDPILTLILLQCQNITSLRICDFPLIPSYSSDGSSGHERLFDILDKHTKADGKMGEGPLSFLTSLELGHDHNDKWRPVDPSFVFPFLKLPAVSILRIHRLFAQYAYLEPSQWPSVSVNANITELALYQVNLDSLAIESVLSNFSNLKILLYEEGGVRVGDADLDPRALFRSLLPFKHSLEKFIFIHDAQFRVGAYEWEEETMGSFKKFNNLRVLHMESYALANSDPTFEPDGRRLVHNIPPRLERLTLRNCYSNAISEVFELLECREEVAPHLKTVIVTSGVELEEEEELLSHGFIEIETCTFNDAGGIESYIELDGFSLENESWCWQWSCPES